MDKKKQTFHDTEIKKHKFHYHKNPNSTDDIHINGIIVSNNNKVSFGKKGFKYDICYKYNEEVKSLCIMVQQVSRYRKSFDETKYVFFDNR